MAENVELSERELEILKLVATGASNKEIGQQLYISANTVKVHLRNIFAKINATTRTEAAMYAVHIGLVQTAPALESVDVSQPDEGDEPAEGAYSSSQVISEQDKPKGWRRYAGWASLAVILVLALVGVWAVTAREPSNPAVSALSTPAVEARWQVKGRLPEPRAGLAVAAVDNTLYAIGGENQDGVLASVDRYNPEQDSWEKRAQKPTAVADVSAAVIGNKIYVPGGRVASGEMTRVLEIYDPASDSWETGASLPEALSAYALAAFEGKLYIFGGWDGANALGAVYQYDPGVDRWSAMTPMPTKRAYSGAGIASGKIYVLGGWDGQKALPVSEVYQPSREDSGEPPWVEAEPMPEGRYGMGVASVVDIIYLIGGTSGEGASASLEFVPSTAVWQAFDLPVSKSWSRMGMVLSGSHLFLLGGELAGAPTDQNLAYQAIYTVSIPSIIK
jgi:DNA-binding CsgD family transcriptional regulator